jgi:hypothetical protein
MQLRCFERPKIIRSVAPGPPFFLEHPHIVADVRNHVANLEVPPPSNIGWGRKSSQMVVTLACLIVVLAGMKAAAGILVPVAYACFLAVSS